jgi:hypothetical protein
VDVVVLDHACLDCLEIQRVHLHHQHTLPTRTLTSSLAITCVEGSESFSSSAKIRFPHRYCIVAICHQSKHIIFLRTDLERRNIFVVLPTKQQVDVIDGLCIKDSLLVWHAALCKLNNRLQQLPSQSTKHANNRKPTWIRMSMVCLSSS